MKSFYAYGRAAILLLATLLCSATSSATKEAIDLIVMGDYVVTMNEHSEVFRQGAVAVHDGKIIAVDTAQSITKRYQATTQIAGDGKILLPGLINGHTHTAMTLFRGVADDLPLMEWLTQYIFPLEAEFVTPEFVEVGAKLACYEMIRTGTTTFVDMYFYPEVIAEVTVNCGLRAIIASPMIDYPSPGFKGWQDSHTAGVEFVKSWQNKHPRITPALAPHAPYTVAPDNLKEVGNSARELNAPISIHLAETDTETQQIAKQYDNTPVNHALQQLGDNRIIGAHVVHPQPQDYPAMQNQRFGAIHNPSSNAKLASGIAPVTELIEAGIAVGLGTDGAASNNDLNMFEEIHLAALLHKLQQKTPEAIPAVTALSLATRSGAQAIGMESTVGQLIPGLAADMIQVQTQQLAAQPVYDVISHLVYVLDGSDVVTTIVDGTVLMQDQKVLTINAERLKQEVDQLSAKIETFFQKASDR